MLHVSQDHQRLSGRSAHVLAGSDVDLQHRPLDRRAHHEPVEFHARVRRQYLDLAAREPGRFVVLDASRPPDEVEAAAWRALESRL